MTPTDVADPPAPDARERLLATVIEHVRKHGIGEPSLRRLAAEVGTSHPLLKYHFGSRDGVLVAVAEAVADQQRQLVEAMVSENASLPVVEQLRIFWRNATRPGFLEYARLFFGLYGQALQGRAHAEGFLDGEVERWLEPLNDLFRRAGLAPSDARIEARLTLATVRGLLLDLLAGNDQRAVEEALDRYLERYAALGEGQPDA